MSISGLTGAQGYFEDFVVGQRMRHARSATITDVENSFVSKLVMNTAQAHWNEEYLKDSPLGSGRVVFGLVTGSLVFGLASQDATEQSLGDLGCDKLRFRAAVHQGDTVSAFTEVVAVEAAAERDDAGVVRFRHWGVVGNEHVVFEGERTVLVKRRSHWGDR